MVTVSFLIAVAAEQGKHLPQAAGVSSNTLGLIGAILGVLAILTTALLGLAQIGVLRRARHLIVAEYHEFDAEPDLPGGETARFVLRIYNRGDVPVSFQGFELLYPRLGAEALNPDGSFHLNGGAQLREDGQPHGRLPSRQEFKLVDRLHRNITVAPHTNDTEFIDALLDVGQPILVFHDSHGNRYHIDPDGIHPGRWEYPHRDLYLAALGVHADTPSLAVERNLFSRRFRRTMQRYASS